MLLDGNSSEFEKIDEEHDDAGDEWNALMQILEEPDSDSDENRREGGGDDETPDSSDDDNSESGDEDEDALVTCV